MLRLFEPTPDFTAPTYFQDAFGEVTLSQLIGRWVVLFFYPFDFSYVCPSEILELSRRADDFRKLGVELLALSCDSKFSHRAWAETLGEIALPLVADFDKSIASAYGVLLDSGAPARATFILDPEGRLQHESLGSPSVGRSIEELLRLVEALQIGALTPVEWKSGQPTLSER